MATSEQEKLYNEIVEYYSFADRLVKAAEDSSHDLSTEQFTIIENVVNNLEDYADVLTSHYIEHVKNGKSEKIIDLVRSTINNIMAKVEECRNKIFMLYQEDVGSHKFVSTIKPSNSN